MAATAVIEVAERGDAAAILQVQQLAYRSEAEIYRNWNLPPLKESLDELLAEFDRQLILKARLNEQPKLVGSVRGSLQVDTCHVGRLAVHPDFQRGGIGRALMRRIEDHFPQARRFELFTGHRSARNLLFYQGLGYVPFREEIVSAEVTLVYLQKSVS